ncbi:coenzyme Q-binding protein COQ10 [Cohaesibacter sp. ES.047]|uniref:type II toxin-antitoxin system RatA family toxin n=1 Tax=Cohaesibacter sp. ES.047 TaxID=1798205 RepID=UPI000BB9772C|nr:type II toxin-antitoxin system RatA family toxin [Cohaesibacter sp. ES.047]SNY93657.1 coenzyme Q-binding protein COQ10 [Cohaesibacter sp. ES.047]
MPKFQTRHKVNHSAQQMYALVADIERYPEFVPLCQHLSVRGRHTAPNGEILVADMTVAYKMIRESFTSKVTLTPQNNQIVAEYLDGPFKHLENRWTFEPIEGETDKSIIVFYIDYEFKSRILAGLMGAMFDKAFAKFTTAFERRADLIYG